MKLGLGTRRTLVLVACGYVLWLIVAQANHYLAPARLYIWVGGLFVTFAALRLPPQEGLGGSFLIGLVLDAVTPVPFGLHAFLFGVAHLVLVRLRHRLAGDVTLVAVTVALLTNLALFLVFTVTRINELPETKASGLRLLMDLITSQCGLVVLAPWYFALQTRALEIAGAGLRVDPAEVI
jgi:cell shape-determining protein MreD